MAETDRSSLGVEIADELSMWLTPAKLHALTEMWGEMHTTGLVPLWYAPLLFCSEPGEPLGFLDDDRRTIKVGRCLPRWVELVARAVERGELRAREPDGLSVLDPDEPVTPDCLLAWPELDEWAKDRHRLPAGFLTMNELKNQSRPVNPLDKPLRDVERRTLLTIIAALAQDAKIDITHYEAAGAVIEKLTDEIGAHVDAGTIARHLKKIPDALEARAK